MCNKELHTCAAKLDIVIPRGFVIIDEFPDYMINRKATVRHIESGHKCWLERVAPNGGAMVVLQKDGKRFTRSAQDLRAATFGDLDGE